MSSITQLHVANTYSKYKNINLSGLLKSIHDEMYQKFSDISVGKGSAGAGSRAEAKELQDFFQDIKAASGIMGLTYLDSIQDTAKRQVLNQIVSTSLRATGFKSLFETISSGQADIYKQGEAFEKQLAAVMASTLNLASNKSTNTRSIKSSMNKIALGKAGAGINPGIVDELAKEGIQAIANEFNSQTSKKNQLSKYVTEMRDGKIDASGLTFTGTITAEPTSYLGKIARLLSKANFTAKSYASEKERWVSAIRMKLITQTKSNTLHLGSTESARVFLTVLGSHLDPPVALSAYMYIINTQNQYVKAMAARMRFIYELTGYGQKYKNNTIQKLLEAEGGPLRANYIIYNDPGTQNIYVRSTADIIIELWDEIQNMIDSESIELSKKLF